MKVLFITPYFPPEVGAPQTRIYELSSRLVGLGHDVSVLTTFPNYPTGKIFPGWAGFLHWVGQDSGMSVRRVWSYTTPNEGFLKRLLGQLSFVVSACFAGVWLEKHDIIVVESPPLFDGFIGLFLGWRHSIPYVFTVADLWPECAIQLGMLRNALLIRLARQMERLFYKGASNILAVTCGIRDTICQQGIQPCKVTLFRNAVDCGFFRPVAEDGPKIRKELGITTNDFLVLYAGTLGLAQDISCVLAAAKLAQDYAHTPIRFLLAGACADRTRLRAEAQQMGLRNTSFVEPYPKHLMPALWAAADCALVTMKNLEIFQKAIPTKMLEAMACEKPIVLAARGEAEEIVLSSRAGICVRPGDFSGLLDAVCYLESHRDDAIMMGTRGRTFIRDHFDRDSRARQLADNLLAIVNSRTMVVAGNR